MSYPIRKINLPIMISNTFTMSNAELVHKSQFSEDSQNLMKSLTRTPLTFIPIILVTTNQTQKQQLFRDMTVYRNGVWG
jgi:hypothetical protein